MKVKTIFIGSGEFAIPILDSLLKSEIVELSCVISQPDKPVGRKQVLTSTPVSEFLQKSSVKIQLEKPAKIRKEYLDILSRYQPELIVVASYGQIIPEEMLEYPKYKSVNVHGSLLPLLRGAVPVQMSILNNFKETGVSIQRMVYQMDAGPIIAKRMLRLTGQETTEILMDNLGVMGAELLTEVLPLWLDRKIEEVVQEETDATYCYKEDISKQRAEITYNTDINLAERMVRAFYPWPITWVKYRDKNIKIFSGVISNLEINSNSLKFIKQNKKLYLVLQNGCLEVLELQEEGKKRDKYNNYFYLCD